MLERGRDVMSADYDYETHGEVVLITLKEDFILNQVKNLVNRVEESYRDGVRNFIFDLSSTEWIDSFGVKCLVKVKSLDKSSPAEVYLVNCRKNIRTILNNLGLDNWFHFCETSAEALQLATGK